MVSFKPSSQQEPQIVSDVPSERNIQRLWWALVDALPPTLRANRDSAFRAGLVNSDLARHWPRRSRDGLADFLRNTASLDLERRKRCVLALVERCGALRHEMGFPLSQEEVTRVKDLAAEVLGLHWNGAEFEHFRDRRFLWNASDWKLTEIWELVVVLDCYAAGYRWPMKEAALDLGVHLPKLSARLSRYEHRLGSQLVQKGPSGKRRTRDITPMGEQVRTHLHELAKGWADVLRCVPADAPTPVALRASHGHHTFRGEAINLADRGWPHTIDKSRQADGIDVHD